MRLPPAVRSWLGRQVQDALQHWPRGTFFAQNPDNYHITLLSDIAVALGEQRHDAPAVRKVVDTAVRHAREAWLRGSSGAGNGRCAPLCLRLTKVTISKASLNCELEAANTSTQRWYDALVAGSGTKQRRLKDQSVTLVRFLVERRDEAPAASADASSAVHASLRAMVDSPITFYVDHVFHVDHLELVTTDKLADNMVTRLTIPLPPAGLGRELLRD